jgi:hypothetical protein
MAGVRSMNTVPIALTGETVDLSRPAASVETPITTAVARNSVAALTISPR